VCTVKKIAKLFLLNLFIEMYISAAESNANIKEGEEINEGTFLKNLCEYQNILMKHFYATENVWKSELLGI